MMKVLYCVLALLTGAISIPAMAQSPANPAPGSLWTYTGTGPVWVPPVTVMGPDPTTMNALAAWNSVNGKMLKDTGAMPGGQSIVANMSGPASWTAPGMFDGLRVAVNNYPLSGEFGGGAFNLPQAIVGAINVPAGAANGFNAAAFAVAGYSASSSPTMGSVGVFGSGSPKLNGVDAWGANFLVNNCGGGVNCTSNAGTTNNDLWGIEVDANIFKVGGAAPANISLNGLHILGASETQVGTGGHSYAIAIGPLGHTMSPPIPWQAAFITTDAAAEVGLSLGSKGASGTVTDSQAICMSAYGGAPSPIPTCLQQKSNGTMEYQGVLRHSFLVAGVTSPVFTLGQFSAVFGPQVGTPGTPGSPAGPASLPSIPAYWNATNNTGTYISSSQYLNSIGHHIFDVPVSYDFKVNGTNALVIIGAPAAAQTSLFLLYNNGTTTAAGGVTVGAADSGGAGYRVLRLPN